MLTLAKNKQSKFWLIFYPLLCALLCALLFSFVFTHARLTIYNDKENIKVPFTVLDTFETSSMIEGMVVSTNGTANLAWATDKGIFIGEYYDSFGNNLYLANMWRLPKNNKDEVASQNTLIDMVPLTEEVNNENITLTPDEIFEIAQAAYSFDFFLNTTYEVTSFVYIYIDPFCSYCEEIMEYITLNQEFFVNSQTSVRVIPVNILSESIDKAFQALSAEYSELNEEMLEANTNLLVLSLMEKTGVPFMVIKTESGVSLIQGIPQPEMWKELLSPTNE